MENIVGIIVKYDLKWFCGYLINFLVEILVNFYVLRIIIYDVRIGDLIL